MGEAFPHGLLIQTMRNGNKFIAAVPPYELFRRHGRAQADGEPPDIGIPRLMPHAVVDSAEIIQVKTAYSHILFRRFRIIQQFFTFILIWKSGRLVQINLFLQHTVHRRIAHRLNKFISNQKHQNNNINRDIFFNYRQRGCLPLGIRLRQSRRLITDFKEPLALINDLCILIADFSDTQDFIVKRGKVIIQLLHLTLKRPVIEAHQPQFSIAIPQTVDKGLNILNHTILRLTGNFQFNDTLCFSAHQSRIIDHTRRSLNTGDNSHHHDNQCRQHNRQHADADLYYV